MEADRGGELVTPYESPEIARTGGRGGGAGGDAWCDGARPRGVVGDGGRTAGELVTPYESPKIPEKT